MYDTYAYVASDIAGLNIVNISDPRNPTLVGYYQTPGTAWKVFVLFPYAYVADGNSGLRIIDISDPQNPYEVGYYVTSGYAWDVYVSDSYAYVVDGNIKVINVSDPSNPYQIGSYTTSGYSRDIYVSGAYAYVASSTGGLRIIDISNPQNPYEVGYCDTPDEAFGVYVVDPYVYVADNRTGLQIYKNLLSNISESVSNPQRVGIKFYSGFFEFYLRIPQVLAINIFDICGRKIFSTRKSFKRGYNKISLYLKKGIYFYIIKSKNLTKKGKFFIVGTY